MSEHDPKPVAFRWAWKTTGSELEQRFADPDLYEWTYRDRPPSSEAAPKMDIEPLYPASVVTALQEEVGRLGQQCEGMAQAAANNAQDLILKCAALKAAEARANAAEQRLKEAVKVLDRCEHDGGFDREIGPIGCMLGDMCVCVGVYPILTGQRAFIKEAGE